MATHDDIIRQLLDRPGVQAEVQRIEREEGELLDALLQARHQAGLSQAQLAARMGTQAPAVARLERALATGCARVNLGTAAIENPEWCAAAIARHGDKIAVGLDVKIKDGQHRLAARGWTTDGGDLWEALARLDGDGCARYVVTDVGKDGTLKGPNVDLLRDVAAATPAPVIASGGIAEVADLVTLAQAKADGANIEGSIVGKALYAGRFTLPEALSAVAAVEAQGRAAG